ncbi:hypothetical protein P170DRAFT_461531 [Aspergillus steynii IBT 23096]|uniref:Uncharacterized protein n=1 Tax=Aspergillus steynii IBT 23096 TaxID=1392250 RepID=A0A2I2GS83_9EURO|nr:uncharacterized protein P170DRAFT_461531 [Aspergillus steynii IBT 23096]PLB55730.1 hypothetical protein P170DRAFT_461531 [Aspergillus steynii IBT 23096]
MTPAPPYTETAHPPPPPPPTKSHRSGLISILLICILCTQIISAVLLGLCLSCLGSIDKFIAIRLPRLVTPTPTPSAMVVRFEEDQPPLPVEVYGIPLVHVNGVDDVVRVTTEVASVSEEEEIQGTG